MTRILTTEGRKIGVEKILLIGGYKKHHRGLIKEDLHGRFHAIIEENKRAAIHYDIYTNLQTKDHFSLPLPEREGLEIKRLAKILYRFPQIPNYKPKADKPAPSMLERLLRKDVVTPEDASKAKNIYRKEKRKKGWRECFRCEKPITSKKVYVVDEHPICDPCLPFIYVQKRS